MMYLKLLLIILGLSFTVSEDCTSFKSCRTCIRSDLHCVWCTDIRKPDDRRPRCESRDKLNDESWCKVPDNPQTEKNEIPGKKSQLQPSLVNITARPGDTVSFSIVYKPENDYPIDIYYLFDNSFTMKSYTEELRAEAINIHSALGKISNNVRFGVGSFVEKLAEPYASEEHGDKLNTFNNHLSLTDDIGIFVEAIKKVDTTSNLDFPEAGLDALMQVLVCDDEIKWRPDARRVVILSTDDTYHSAGDGMAVGAYMPNDMKCHLNKISSNITTHELSKDASLRFDYPSVSQISYMAAKKGIFIFFTATKKVEAEYKALAEAVQGSKYIELKVKTDKTKSTLVQTIVDEYTKLSQSLQIPRPKVSSHLELTLSPNCEKKDDINCAIPYNGEIKIDISLTVKSCPTGNTFTDTLIVSPNGMPDKLNIKVLVLCQCDCERYQEDNSVMCRPENVTETRGVLQCGECKCYKNWYGRNCACKGTSTEEEDLRKCKASEKDKLPCSGKGICRCGECKSCWEGYAGPQCQYRTDACPVFEDKVCAGHGRCKEEKCKCDPGWKGDDCSCTTKSDMCVGANGKVCFERGECTCGMCECSDSNKYSGQFCDQCDTCNQERCEQLHDYVVCIYDGEKIMDKQTCDKKTEFKNNIIEVEIKNQTEINAWSDANYCEKVLDDESIIMYKYHDGNNFTKIWIQKEKKLPPVRNIWVPIGGAIGGILLIGILTLIAWKVLVDIMDAREYRKFAEEAQRSGFDVMDNPLYKPAAVSINNPAYEKY